MTMKMITNDINDEDDEVDEGEHFQDKPIDKCYLPTYVDSAISHLHYGYGEVQAQGVVHYLDMLRSLSRHVILVI